MGNVLVHTPMSLDGFIAGENDDMSWIYRSMAAADGRDVLVPGADVVDRCLEAGLVDEIPVHIVPELIAEGVRLFGAQRSAPRSTSSNCRGPVKS